MRRALWVGLVIVGFSGTALCLTLRSTVAVAEQSRDESLRHAEDALGTVEDALQRPFGSRSAPPALSEKGPREGQ